MECLSQQADTCPKYFFTTPNIRVCPLCKAMRNYTAKVYTLHDQQTNLELKEFFKRIR